MRHSIRLFPQMGLKSFAFGLKDTPLCPNSTINFRFYTFLGLVFGLLATFSINFSVKNWYFRFGVFGDGVTYYIFLILSQLILGFSIWRLKWKCNRFERILARIWAKLTQNRDGFSLKLKNYETELKNQVSDLQRKLRRERKMRKEAILELERERDAAASASEEAMAKIMFLEREKASIEREARHYRELMEKKQMYDQEMMEHLQFVIERIERGESPSALRSVQMGDDEFEDYIV